VIHPDDVLVLESGGGGGWGDPAERDPAAVAGDIENGFTTNEMAARAAVMSPPLQAGEG
jgi:N-methylhydantoinase B